ncbi:60S ribosomal export protein NMD3 [Hondaea fermentalgiana]|uniref:60S ribosomal export protein NMD3 n=1 Tax=Hondaea fermentalgiana TaxID=2315210 RepID=A0A2R5G5Z6_9STRA|nr:60S ribosomal export protein NMD3 [Hondaea fermentalgiana]|eukprot:GBG25759.1 60S ribosomal export protein NMD3 [Hondaea fermentalgiana]
MAGVGKPALPDIACCMCGVSIQPNDVNMCLQCLKDRVDVTEGISKQEVIWSCSGCGKVKSEEGRWLACEPESAELLALCLKAVHGLGKGKGKGQKNGAHFVDASWIWTEPHSRRLRIRITVEKEVFNGAVVRQRFEVEFIVKTRLCTSCVKETTDQQWTTVVQVRQQVSHKRTLLNLENRLLQGGGARGALDVIPVSTGIDFYFANKTLGNKFSDFVMSAVPARRKESKSLQGADLRSNTYNYRHSIAIEVVPICKHDFVILPHKLQHSLFGGKSAAVLCYSVTRTLNLIDPYTGARAKLQDVKYWPNAFRPIATSRNFTEFTVLDVQPLSYGGADSGDGEGPPICEVEVARMADFGVNDERFTVNSHIGMRLEAGDTVLGYDFSSHNLSDDLTAPLKGRELEPIVLVQKYVEKTRKPRHRKPRKAKGKVSSTEADADIVDGENAGDAAGADGTAQENDVEAEFLDGDDVNGEDGEADEYDFEDEGDSADDDGIDFGDEDEEDFIEDDEDETASDGQDETQGSAGEPPSKPSSSENISTQDAELAKVAEDKLHVSE